jgi:aryl-alcohol dehydrogenase-like predicted oxidoreductase
VNWIDTAPVYGGGRAEEVVGRAIAGRDDVLVNTKCGHKLAPDGKSTYVDTSPDSVRAECEESLRRLGRDHIDVYQFHLPDAERPPEEAWATLVALRDEGKVRWIGASNWSVEALARCEPVGHVDVNEPQYNLMHREIELDLLPWSSDNGTGVVVYETQQTGLLSGAFSREHLESLPPDDFRKGFADFQEPNLSRALALVEQIRPIADGLGVSVSELVIAYAIAHPAITGAIVGASTTAQIDGWIGAGDLELDAATVTELTDTATRAGYPTAGVEGYTSIDSRAAGVE